MVESSCDIVVLLGSSCDGRVYSCVGGVKL